MKKLTIEVKKDKDKLLKYLCDSNINISYSNLNKLLRKKDVKVNGIRQTENIDIVRGDVIDVFVNENMLTTKSDAVKVIYEDDNILIIDKPRLKEVISGVGYDLLQDAREYLKSKDPSSYIAPVHRLDKDTRGLVVFAKNQKSENELLEAFKNRTIHNCSRHFPI